MRSRLFQPYDDDDDEITHKIQRVRLSICTKACSNLCRIFRLRGTTLSFGVCFQNGTKYVSLGKCPNLGKFFQNSIKFIKNLESSQESFRKLFEKIFIFPREIGDTSGFIFQMARLRRKFRILSKNCLNKNVHKQIEKEQ